MSSSQSPQSMFGRADDLISQAIALHTEAKELAEKANQATIRATSLEDAAATLQHTATLDRKSLNLQLEDVFKRHKDILEAFRKIPERASQVQRIILAAEEGTASSSDIVSFETDLVAFQESGSKKEKNARVYIGGMPHYTSKAELFKLFSGYEVLHCCLERNRRSKPDSQHGFVVLRDASVAQHAVETLSGSSILGNQVSIQLAKDWNHQSQQTQKGERAHVHLPMKRPISPIEDNVVTDTTGTKHPRLQPLPGSFQRNSPAVESHAQSKVEEMQEIVHRSVKNEPSAETAMTSAFNSDFIPFEDANDGDTLNPEYNAIEKRPLFQERDERSSHIQPGDSSGISKDGPTQLPTMDTLSTYQLDLLGFVVDKAKSSPDEARNYLMKEFPRSQKQSLDSREVQAKSGTIKLTDLAEIVGPCCLVLGVPFSMQTTQSLRHTLETFGRIVTWKEGEFWRMSKRRSMGFRIVLLRYSDESSSRKAYEAGRELLIVPGTDLLIFKPIR